MVYHIWFQEGSKEKFIWLKQWVKLEEHCWLNLFKCATREILIQYSTTIILKEFKEIAKLSIIKVLVKNGFSKINYLRYAKIWECKTGRMSTQLLILKTFLKTMLSSLITMKSTIYSTIFLYHQYHQEYI
jgi:hypothetical protein